MVEPMGFEPTTFPVSPGRADQLLDVASVLLFLYVLLAADGITAGGVLFRMDELPWSAISQRKRVIGIVICNALFQVFCLANVIAARRFALKDVNDI
jgi:hypothetical protein